MLLDPPKDTAELMKLIAYANEVETVTLREMEQTLGEVVMKYLLFLTDHHLLSPLELKQNTTTIIW